MVTQATSNENSGLLFHGHSHRPMIHHPRIFAYDLFEKLWIIVRDFEQVLCRFNMTFLLLSWQEPQNKFCDHVTIRFMPRSFLKLSETQVCRIPRYSNYCTISHRFLLIAANRCSTFSCVLLVEGLPQWPSDNWVIQ